MSPKQEVRKVSKKNINEAYDRINNCLDVIQLSRDIEALRFLISVIWTKPQSEKLPTIVFVADSSTIKIHEYFERSGKTPDLKKAIDDEAFDEKDIYNSSISRLNSTPVPNTNNNPIQLKDKCTDHENDTFLIFKAKYKQLTDEIEQNLFFANECVKAIVDRKMIHNTNLL